MLSFFFQICFSYYGCVHASSSLDPPADPEASQVARREFGGCASMIQAKPLELKPEPSCVRFQPEGPVHYVGNEKVPNFSLKEGI